MRKVGVEEQHRDGEERVVIEHVAKRRADRGVEHDLQKVEKPRRHERHHQKIHKEEDRSGDALGMVHAAGGGFLFCHGETSFPGKLRKLLLELVEMEMRELLDQYDFDGDNTPIIRGSALGALNGVPKWEDKIMELMDACDTWIQDPPRDLDKPFLMPVEDVFSITGRGTVATGRIETGKIHVGDEVEILGLGEDKKSVVTGVEMFRKILDEGQAGDNVGLLLRGVDKSEIKRGMVLCHPGQVKPFKKFKASIYVLKKEEGGRHTPFGNKYRPQFYLRTMDCTGEIHLPEGIEMVMPGDNVEITVELIYAVALNVGLRFAIREGGRTVGSGQITEVYED